MGKNQLLLCGTENYIMFCSSKQLINMAARTRTLSVRITERQYEELEELVERGEYASKDEFIRELLRQKFEKGGSLSEPLELFFLQVLSQ